MKRYSPGASIKSDYYYICDMCGVDDGRGVLVWDNLPRRKGHFALCYQCVARLYIREYLGGPKKLTVARAVIPEWLRNQVFERDGYKCVKCGATGNLQLDHIIPFSKGGKTEFNNLETLCKTCNLKKGTK